MSEKKIVNIELESIKLNEFKEKPGSKDPWVSWGNKNNFPDIITSLLYNSALHHNIVKKRIAMICGDGVAVNKSSNKNKIATEKFINNINRYGETLEDIIEKLATDYVSMGSAALQVIWGKGGNQIAELFHLPINNLRLGKKDELGNINKYYYSNNWQLCRRPEFTPFPITAYSNIPELIAIDPTQVIIFSPYSFGSSYYSQPDYVGGLNYINLDWQMSEFANSYVKNGFFPNVMINFKNINDEDKEYVTNQFTAQYTTAPNNNKVLFNFLEGDSDIKIEPLSVQGMETMISAMNDLATENVLQAHGMPGILVGIAEAGSLGDASQINNAYLQYENSKTLPAQNFIMSKINKLLSINGLDEVTINSSTPIPFSVNEDTMQNVLTVTELRDMLGFGPLDPSNYGDIVSNIANKATPTTPVTNSKQNKK